MSQIKAVKIITGDSVEMKNNKQNVKNLLQKDVKNMQPGHWPIYWGYYAVGPAGIVRCAGADDHDIIRKTEKSIFWPEKERDTYVVASDSTEGAQQIEDDGTKAITLYSPLSMPELFLEFAALADKEVTLEVMLGWVGRYGVLGLEGTEGGPQENLRNFASAAEEANSVLRLYEAFAEPEGPRSKQLRELNHVIRRPAVFEKLPLKASTTLEELRDTLLRWATNTVNEMVTRECYPVVYGQRDEYRQGWGFKSLLGAMYLQMMQLITTAGKVRKCKGPDCWRIIAFEPGEPYAGPGFDKNVRGKYKTRIDKEFCSTNCRVKWHYHNVIKPRRESERAATS